MKVFNLSCDNGHAFEGWFRSQEDLDLQSEQRLVECPICGSGAIRRLPSAPRLNLGAAQPSADQQPEPPSMSQRMQAIAVKMAREIAARTEDVGERFAEEARRIHYKEVPERGIRGVATRDEAEALIDEGIGVVPLPLASLIKEPLQ